MTCAFTSFGHECRATGVEEHDRLGSERTEFCYSKRQNVDTGLPCYLRRRRAEADQGVGKTSAIHMNGKGTLMSDLGKSCNLVWTVNSARFGCLGNRDRRSDHLVWAVSKSVSQEAC